MITGDQLDLFLDKEDLAWGDHWRSVIDESVAERMCFVAVMTPSYFRSAECRRELTLFIQSAKKLGLDELLLPLYYVETPMLEEDTEDELVQKIRQFQREEWRDLRLSELSSEPYRRGVNRLARRLACANRRAEKVASAERSRDEPAAEEGNLGEPEAPAEGTLDQLAAMEEALPEWKSTMEEITDETKGIGAMLNDAAAELNRHAGSTFKHKRSIVRELARRMEQPVNTLAALSAKFVSSAYGVDAGVRVVIEQAAAIVEADPERRDVICGLFEQIRSLSITMAESLGKAEEAREKALVLETVSRDFQPVVRRWRQGMTTLLEAGNITDEWIALIDESGVECEGLAS